MEEKLELIQVWLALYDPRTRASRQDAEQAIADAEAFLEKGREILEKTLGKDT